MRTLTCYVAQESIVSTILYATQFKIHYLQKSFVVNFVFVEYISATVGTCVSGIAILLYIDEFVLLGGVT